MTLDHVVTRFFDEWRKAELAWADGVLQAFGDFELFFRSFFTSPFTTNNEYLSGLQNAVGNYLPLLRGAVAATVTAVSLDLLLADKKLHQRVIPLDKVVAAFGPGFAREMLGGFTSPEITSELGIMAKVKKPFGAFLALPRFLANPTVNAALGKAVGPVALLISSIIEGCLLAFGFIFTVIMISILQDKVEELFTQALPQTNKRKREKVSISRRVRGVAP